MRTLAYWSATLKSVDMPSDCYTPLQMAESSMNISGINWLVSERHR
jgi:hypothetical protein